MKVAYQVVLCAIHRLPTGFGLHDDNYVNSDHVLVCLQKVIQPRIHQTLTGELIRKCEI